MRYTTDNPPPLEPPAEVAAVVNPGVWRVAARGWRDHQPDEGGRVCRTCFRLYPCPGVLGADGVLDTIWQKVTARGRAALPRQTSCDECDLSVTLPATIALVNGTDADPIPSPIPDSAVSRLAAHQA